MAHGNMFGIKEAVSYWLPAAGFEDDKSEITNKSIRRLFDSR
jgi:hypothetical protein